MGSCGGDVTLYGGNGVCGSGIGGGGLFEAGSRIMKTEFLNVDASVICSGSFLHTTLNSFLYRVPKIVAPTIRPL